MISDRPYRPAMPIDDALEELHRNAGTQFDAHIVDEFQQLTTELSTGELIRAA
jgi:HD-GYP domain-containing protein (c-di-GMP phosphodiesterase class II)